MIRVNERGEAQLLDPKPQVRLHWRRNKRPTVNLVHDSPFALERQLEDQRLMLERNRNPLEQSTSRAEKSRSERHLHMRMMKPPSGNIRTKVINRIVREESGVNSYVLMEPAGARVASPPHIDVETVPFLLPYRRENNVKPVMTTYGHRPSSASRVFHPSTMKVRLRHGEVVSARGAGESRAGLPVAILSTILAHRPPPPADEGARHVTLEEKNFFHAFDYNINVSGEVEPEERRWNNSLLLDSQGAAAAPSKRNRLLLPVSERLTRFRTLAVADLNAGGTLTGSFSGQSGSSSLGGERRGLLTSTVGSVAEPSSSIRDAQLSTLRRRDAQIRRWELEVARSRIPRVEYEPGAFMGRLPPLAELFGSAEEQQARREIAAELRSLQVEARPTDSAQAAAGATLRSKQAVSRVYSGPVHPACATPATTRILSPSSTPAASLSGRGGSGRDASRASTDRTLRRNSADEWGTVAVVTTEVDGGGGGGGDPLFDFMMQTEDATSSLVRRDSELRAYLEHRALRRRHMRSSNSNATLPAVRRKSSAGDGEEDTGRPAMTLYINRSFDLNKPAYLAPIAREVRALEERMLNVPVSGAEPAATSAVTSSAMILGVNAGDIVSPRDGVIEEVDGEVDGEEDGGDGSSAEWVGRIDRDWLNEEQQEEQAASDTSELDANEPALEDREGIEGDGADDDPSFSSDKDDDSTA